MTSIHLPHRLGSLLLLYRVIAKACDFTSLCNTFFCLQSLEGEKALKVEKVSVDVELNRGGVLEDTF